MKTIIIQLVASFLGSLGFSLLFNVEKKKLLPCSLGGVFIWGVYLICTHSLGLGDLAASAISAGACQLFAEGMARLMKAPTTIFCIPALVPLIPGGSLYRTMDAVIARDWEKFYTNGSATLQITFGIALGLSLISGLLFTLRKKKKIEKI